MMFTGMGKSRLRVVGCFLESEGKILLLLRNKNRPDGNTWGLPSGKVEAGESDVEAMIRELREETGYKTLPEELEFVVDWVYDFPDLTLEYPTYRIRLAEPIKITHQPDEHTDWQWIKPEACKNLRNPIRGLMEILKVGGYVG